MEISIIGATISGNRGAEAMLSTVIGLVRNRWPKARFNVFSYYAKEDNKKILENNIDNMHVYRSDPIYVVVVLFTFSILYALLKKFKLSFLSFIIPKSVKHLYESSVLVDIAGVSFIDGREKFLPFNILTIMPAIFLNVPVVKASQAIGPFNNRINRWCASNVLNRCTYIVARGQETFNHITQLGIDKEKYGLFPDITYCYTASYSLSSENEHYVLDICNRLELVKSKSRNTIIGLCPSSVIEKKAIASGIDYIQFNIELIHALWENGYVVLLFPNATHEKKVKSFRNNDLRTINKIMSLIDESEKEDIIAVQKDINSSAIERLIAYTEAVIASRFHAMIASLRKEKPVFVVGWSHKYREVLKDFRLSDLVYDFSSIDTKGLIEDIVSFVAQREKTEKLIISKIDEVKNKAEKQIEIVFNLVDIENEKSK